MQMFRLTLWSQYENGVVSQKWFRGTRNEAERVFSEFWNDSPAVAAEVGRYRARLHEAGTRRVLSTIG